VRPAPQTLKLLTLFALLAAVDMSCRPASYEILKPSHHTNHPNGNPQQVNPPGSSADAPSGPGRPGGKDGELPPDNAAPTARIEVIWKNESVIKVRVNEPTSIRPTADTVDPDDVGKSACANPGIVKAAFDVAHEAAPVVERTGCEPLSTPYTFTHTGEYLITMVVTSNEGETATAQMTLTVVAADAPLDAGDGGFTIVGNPAIGGKDQVFTFVGYCALVKAHTISWDFGDAKDAQGDTVTHVYEQLGAHAVKAACTDITGKSIQAQIVVVTMENPVVPPVVPTIPVLPPTVVAPPVTPQPVPGTQPDQGQPGQGPNQGAQQQPPADCPCTDPNSGTWYNPEPVYYTPY
jgi:hypothetical protein